MYYLYWITVVAVSLSLIGNRRKTLQALKVAFKKFVKILPAFATMLIFVSIVLYLFPEKAISYSLGNSNKYIASLLASLLGSIAIIPGFVAFPLAGILLKKGVAYMTLSAFTTTLMMVGVITYPVEKAYFGVRVTVMRNIISFFVALFVALMTGILFGEVF